MRARVATDLTPAPHRCSPRGFSSSRCSPSSARWPSRPSKPTPRSPTSGPSEEREEPAELHSAAMKLYSEYVEKSGIQPCTYC